MTDEATDLLRHSLAPATERALRGDLTHFQDWGGSLPATPAMICAYVGDHAGHHAVATIQRRVASISKAHEMAGLPNPVRAEIVKATLRGLRRKHGTLFAERMDKSLNNKPNRITDDQIAHLTRIYGNYRDGEQAEVVVNKKTGERETRTVSRIFKNHEFGFLRIVVERPLRMNFQTTPERIARLDLLDPDTHPVWTMRAVVEAMDASRLYMDLAEFDADVVAAAADLDFKLSNLCRRA